MTTFPLSPLETWIRNQIGAPAGLTREQLERYQLERLNETLALAREKSPFYRQHLAGASAGLERLGDLALLPFTTPQHLRDSGLRFLCVSQDEIQRVVTLDSTGTTGKPKRIYFTREDQELTVDFFQVGMSTFTAPGDRVLILLPGERSGSVGDLLFTALKRLGAIPIKYGIVRDIPQALAAIKENKVDGLVGIPVQALWLARHGQDIRLKFALLSTDHVPQAICHALERTWGCTVYNHYGMTEMGLGGGVDCQARRGYHLREADLYVEIVDPRTGLPVADGESGEVVFSTLTRRGMPLIRYRSGDSSRFIPGPCPCGTCLKSLQHIRGRLAAGLSPDLEQELSIGDLDEALFSLDAIDDFTASVSRLGGWPVLTLRVNPLAGQEDGLEDRIQAALRGLPAVAVQRWEVRIEILPLHTIPPHPFKRILLNGE